MSFIAKWIFGSNNAAPQSTEGSDSGIVGTSLVEKAKADADPSVESRTSNTSHSDSENTAVEETTTPSSDQEDMVKQVVDIFYDIILKDDRVNFFFEGINMQRQRRMMTRFLTQMLGGKPYNGRSMREAHRKINGLNDSHYDAVLEDLYDAFIKYGNTEEFAKNVIAVAETVRDDVLSR
ncbi:hypothetical protein EV182_005426 [Spiromyces aspiralis]|uniref:Uncharacterized protein n=1 Tax=Spiromyces aspiralis TaxID=68401 RepID=A0ACC1HTX7_9FUNG|nr:hypothetical protein EV182_005426 [Spiromyces aspiralis]